MIIETVASFLICVTTPATVADRASHVCEPIEMNITLKPPKDAEGNTPVPSHEEILQACRQVALAWATEVHAQGAALIQSGANRNQDIPYIKEFRGCRRSYPA
jgi:hypothetical protein